MAVAEGGLETLVVGEDGRVFEFGCTEYDRSRMGDTAKCFVLRRVEGLPPTLGPVRQVAAGSNHMGIVTEAGDLLMYGIGWDGRLGLGDEDTRRLPRLVPRAEFDGEAVLMVACGHEHTAVVTESGGVYTFGNGDHGKLGHGDEETQLAPRRVPAAGFNGERIVMVAAGVSHTVALSEAGHVFAWGFGNNGQLGQNNWRKLLTPQQVDPRRFALAMGRSGHEERVVFIAAESGYTVAVTTGGRLYTWGSGRGGQLGHDNTNNMLVPTLVPGFGGADGRGVVMVSCGSGHIMVVTEDGALWACGNVGYGLLRRRNSVTWSVFEQVGDSMAFDGAKVVAAAAGSYHSAVLTEDGALWTWFRDRNRLFGNGGTEHRLVPTRVNLGPLPINRVGRCRPLPTDHAVALAMGTHGRLGAASAVRTLAGEPGLLTMIASAASHWVSGVAGKSEGLVRLLGGVSAARQRRYAQTTQA